MWCPPFLVRFADVAASKRVSNLAAHFPSAYWQKHTLVSVLSFSQLTRCFCFYRQLLQPWWLKTKMLTLAPPPPHHVLQAPLSTFDLCEQSLTIDEILWFTFSRLSYKKVGSWQLRKIPNPKICSQGPSCTSSVCVSDLWCSGKISLRRVSVLSCSGMACSCCSITYRMGVG